MSCLIVLRDSKFGTRAIAAVVSSPMHLIVVKRNLILRECLISTFSSLVTDTGSTRTWTRSAFRRFLQDVIRVWPGPGCPGLSLLQLGVSSCQRRSTTSRNHPCRFRHLQLSRYPTRKRNPMTTYAG